MLVLAAGFLLRCVQARLYFLDPDEALHFLLASHNSVALTYKATLTTAHPPLFIFVLNFWRSLFSGGPGQSELTLRMPSLLTGTASCWLIYLWLRRITAISTAMLGLILAAFAPSLIELSAQIRQYALLLFFVSLCLYLSERALQQNSPRLMAAFSLSLYGALLTHYSALLFAFSIGVYMLVRLDPRPTGSWESRAKLFVTWAIGQLVGIGLAIYFLLTHIPRLRQMGMPQGIAETWLRKSIFHAGENSLLLFPAQQTLRVFTYIFSHGFLGTVALLAFFGGMIWLLRKSSAAQQCPSPSETALLLGLPFLANCIVAIAGLYPYGGTRHNVYLAPFALAGIAIGISSWTPANSRGKWLPAALVVLCLGFCNLFPAPPPMIRARNHNRELMNNAVAYLHQNAQPGAVLFADYQSGLLLGYYVCGHGVVEEFPPLPPFTRANCDAYSVITTQPQEWKFYSTDMPAKFSAAAKAYGLAPGSKVWLFDAGWITDSAPALIRELPGLGCASPKRFGENILICELTVPGT